MKTIIRWFLDNPVASNLLMLFILIAGVLTLPGLRVESFPQIPPTEVEISIAYPGGTARQVDEGVTQRVEAAISGIPGIKRLTSQSSAGYASVIARKTPDVKLDELISDIRNRLESIKDLPTLAERPRIQRNDYTNLAAFVMVYGDESDATLQQVASNVERALQKHPAISKVDNLGKRKPLLVVEPLREQLQRYDLSLEELANHIRQWSLEYRSGELSTARGTILIRASTIADNVSALKNIPIVSTPTARTLLGDIATVRRDFEQSDSIVRYQGVPAIALMVSTGEKDDLFKISDAIQSVLQASRPLLPQSVKVDVMADMSPYISEQLDLLGTNAWQGLLIVVAVLSLFLEPRLALWVALGISISLAGAVAVMGWPGFDYSINDITLFGLILVLGILVDDAVVVGESIHRARQQSSDIKEAVWRGVEAVTVPTVFGVLTTIAAFSPMLWIENELAKVFAGFSAVVIFALVFSLIESKLILPTHLSYRSTPVLAGHRANRLRQGFKTLRESLNRALETFADRVYVPGLTVSLKHRRTCLMLFTAFFLAAYGALSRGNISSVFFPDVPGRYVTVNVTMQSGASNALTVRNTSQLERAFDRGASVLRQTYGLAKPAISKIVVAKPNAESIELTAELTPEVLAKVPGDQILDELRQQAGPLEGSYAVSFSLSEDIAGGTAIEVAAGDRDLARQVAQKLKTSLAQMPGVNDVYDDTQLARRQLKATVNQHGISLGIDQRRLAAIVGGAFGKIEIHRLLDQGEETTVSLRFPRSQAKTLDQLKTTPIKVAQNSYASLGDVATLEYVQEPEVIYRRNRDEVVSIYWQQNRDVSSPEQTWARLQEHAVHSLEQSNPGVSIRAVGEFDEILDVQAGFKRAMLLTVVLIYILLAIPLKSYVQPIIIMSIIPAGFAGAIIGHGLLGLSVSILSLFGMMAMMGVVINDSLVLMSRFNQLRAAGTPIRAALIDAGRSRLRAIFLTTVTTICGLLPLLFETSEQAQYLKPAAVSLVFGELFATPITLILVPVLMSAMERQRAEHHSTAVAATTG
ncbi:MAG: efflux RND transporter permease subunit [Pseudomonadota bacterium]